MTHPSIRGLREAVAEALRKRWREFENASGEALPMPTATVALDAIAAYLTEHGVGWFGEGLVRAEGADTETARRCAANGRPKLFRLVPVPQDGG